LEGRTGIAETTRDGYEREVKRLIEAIGSQRLRDLTTATISTFYASLTDAGLSPKTVKNCHSVLHKALSDAVRQDVLRRNPADHVELPRAHAPEMETWTADQLRRFLDHVAGHRMHAAFLLMCSTGMRRSEVLGLRWTNLDLDTGKLAVVDTVVPVRSKPVLRLGETKSRCSRRVIALDGRTVAVLREHKAAQAAERLRAGQAWENLDLVFTDELGGIFHPDTFTRNTKALAVEAGVPALTPHSAARHTWATLALSSGVHPKVVQERLGHSSISITLDRYSHIIDGMDREAAETVIR
jgi:integrase